MFVLPFAHGALRPYRPALRRVDGGASLARAIDQLFDNAPLATPGPATRTPALDVDETDTHYLLSFELPGVEKQQLSVSVEGRRVRIETAEPAAAEVTDASAAPADAPKPAVARNLYRERTGVRYARTVSLPQAVDSDASEARLEQGVLTLRLAKLRADGARQLTVN